MSNARKLPAHEVILSHLEEAINAFNATWWNPDITDIAIGCLEGQIRALLRVLHHMEIPDKVKPEVIRGLEDLKMLNKTPAPINESIDLTRAWLDK